MAVLVISVDTVGRIIAEQISGMGEGALGLLLIISKVLVVVALWNVGLLVAVSCVGLTFGSGLSLWCTGDGKVC